MLLGNTLLETGFRPFSRAGLEKQGILCHLLSIRFVWLWNGTSGGVSWLIGVFHRFLLS